MNASRALRILALFLLPLLVASCAKEPPAPGMKIGKPYQIYGKWYKPSYESDYDEVGTASWYGPGFHGNYTASGERFDKNSLTAAHTTLPMPSMVRVTNLDNNRSVIVRINDRGPFAENRIIDLSRKAAEELGMLKTGTAKVRVQYLQAETERYLVENNIKGREKIMSSNATRDLNRRQLESSGGREYQVADAAPVESVGSVEIRTAAPQQASPAAEEIDFVDVSSTRPAPSSPGEKEYTPSYSKPQEPVQQVDVAESRPVARSAHRESSGSVKTGIFIQAGTFGNKDNAEKLAGKLSGEGEAQISEITVGDQTMYRVRIGSFPSVDDATSALERIHGMGIADARMLKVSE